MAVTSNTKRAAGEAATSALRAMDCGFTSLNWPAGVDTGGALNVPGWLTVSADRPYVAVATDRWPVPTPAAWQQAWDSILKSPSRGSAGILSTHSDLGTLLPRVGSSSLIVDLRSMKRPSRTTIARLSNDGFPLPVADQLKELRAALSLNKAQLARVLQVARPTVYEWYEGKDPNLTNSERIRTLLQVLARGAVSGARPLNARFVRQPMGLTEPSLLDLLCEKRLDQERLAHVLKRARDLGDAAFRKRKDREDRLHALGFEDLSRERRKELLARNVALQDWPRQ